MSNLIATDVQKQEVDSGLVELFILEIPSHLADGDSQRLYFHAGKDENLTDITFRDNYSSTISTETPTTQFHTRTYTAIPIILEGISADSEGSIGRPTMTIANAESVFRGQVEGLHNESFTNKDLIGCKVTKRTTLKKHLNTGTNTSAPVEFPTHIYTIDRIASETSISIEFELIVPYDLETITLPRRAIVGKYCSWVYQGFDENNPAKQRGACFWKANGEVPDRNPNDSWVVSGESGITSLDKKFRAYFDAKDAPLVPIAMFAGSASNTTYGDWVSGTTYTRNDYVRVIDGSTATYYLSLIEPNQGLNPATNSGSWLPVKVWTPWSSTNVAYTAGLLVKYGTTFADQTIWKCILAHNSSNNNAPANRSAFWIREDVCGKELSSCSIRYAALSASQAKDANNYINFATSSEVDHSKTLPFGAFPGTDRFK